MNGTPMPAEAVVDVHCILAVIDYRNKVKQLTQPNT